MTWRALFCICVWLSLLLPEKGVALWWTETISPQAERAKNLLQGFDEVVEQAMIDFQVPGMAIAIISNGEPVYIKGFGLRNREKSEKVTPDTLFGIGSCTKAFTVFAMGCLVDEGLLGWDMPVLDAVPEFRLYDQYATQNLALRDLLCHRSGVPRHNFMWYNSSLTRQEIMHRLRYLKPACGIRERFNYNDMMFLVAGTAMERVCEKSWEEIVTQKILAPLEMTHTNFSAAEMLKTSNYAKPYLEKEGKLTPMAIREFSMIGPAASINSSVSDLSRWMQMLLNQGEWKNKSLISSGSLREIFAPQIVMTGYPDGKEVQVCAYALGWCVQSYRGHYNVSHDGGVDGYTSVVSLLPGEKTGVAILCNKNLTALPRFLTLHLFDRLLEQPLGDWLTEGLEAITRSKEAEANDLLKESVGRKKGTLPCHSLEEYVGSYFDPGYGTMEIELNEGKLEAHFNGIVYDLDHWHYDVFSIGKHSEDLILSRKGAKISFHNNTNGEIESLSIPFEWSAPDVVFKRKQKGGQAELAYLKKFSGVYEIYGYLIDMVVRDRILYATIPGQPPYELVPGTENEFSVKSLPGYTVRFMPDESGVMAEVMLVLPYGIVYTAKRT